MKSAHVRSSILLAVFVFLLFGCKSKEAASNTAAKPAPVASPNRSPADNSNQSAQTAGANGNANASKEADPAAKEKASAAPKLVGTYESREVQDQGVVTLISQLRTLFVFRADGTYSRVSQVKGKTYHSDSGQFRIEAPDKLVLTIQVTGQKAKRTIQNPPVEKMHKFSLSPDAEELRLISDKGSIAIFRRVTKPNPS